MSAPARRRLPLLQRDGRRQLEDDRQLPHQLDRQVSRLRQSGQALVVKLLS